MISKELRVAIIGAGPGGLFTAKELTKGDHQGIDVHVFDGGRSAKKKVCPSLAGRECKGCGGVCNVNEGQGGSCTGGSSGILSKHPAGHELARYIGLNETLTIQDEIISFFQGIVALTFVPAFAEGSPKGFAQQVQSVGFNIKAYDTHEVRAGDLHPVTDRLTNTASEQGAVLHWNTKVKNIVRETGGRFRITFANGTTECFDKVVFSGGRAGLPTLEESLATMGVKIPTVSGHIGYRVETQQIDPLLRVREFALDPKVTWNDWKMFCFCPEGQLVLMFVRQNGYVYTTLEGRVKPDSPYGNFSSQMKLKRMPYADFQRKWHELMGLTGKISPQGTHVVHQTYDSYLRGDVEEPSQSSASHRAIAAPIRPLLATFLSPQQLDHGDTFLHTVATKLLDLDPDRLSLIAPELHFWPDIPLEGGLQVAGVPGFYVIGDASSAFRGIMQAATGGVAVARGIKRS